MNLALDYFMEPFANSFQLLSFRFAFITIFWGPTLYLFLSILLILFALD